MIQPQGVDEDDVDVDATAVVVGAAAVVLVGCLVVLVDGGSGVVVVGDVVGVVVAIGGRSVLVVGAKVLGGTEVGVVTEGPPVEVVVRLPEGRPDPEPPHAARMIPAARIRAIPARRLCPFIGYIGTSIVGRRLGLESAVLWGAGKALFG